MSSLPALANGSNSNDFCAGPAQPGSISPDPAAITREWIARKNCIGIEALHIMDCDALEFEDGSFDVVLDPYLLSVVPSLKRMLVEIWRVTRVGGEMIILSHILAERGPRARIEKCVEGAGGWQGSNTIRSTSRAR
ncbi:class I SAM-dependent methyltransferase [Labrys okinawensis]|uniref:class I SAM-dependent methyltransferase n=1 Tax=Labrys okinawensis TaxID=346911 RepID=UPI0039BCCE1F